MLKFANSPDGGPIAYSSQGAGEPSIVFIHGGLADRTFWSGQMDAFSDHRQVVALDLAGHGESGGARPTWSIQACGGDVRVVLEAENLNRAVLVGNSLGGPVAAEAALLAPDRVAGIVAVDTFHDLSVRFEAAEAMSRAEAFRSDFAGSVHSMVAALFHPDADPELMAAVEERMSRTSRETPWHMFHSFAGYDLGATVRRLKVPIRCINGDLYPVAIEANRRVYADFDVVILPHIGHYPMLECPQEFNRILGEILSRF